MAGPQNVTGPDLEAEGIPIADLPEDEPVAAQLDGAPVVVIRTATGIHALGAKCTHYGSLLSDGTCAGGLLRCPSHHAAFDVETGAAVRAPAMNPVARYVTEVRDGRLYITDVEVPTRAAAPRVSPESVVIVGAGAAGEACAETLRAHGYTGPVTLVGDEPPVDRPNLSKDYLAGTAPEDWIPLRSPEWYADADIHLVTDDPVTGIDVGARTVSLRSGTELGYDALLLATGAEPRKLPVPGADLPHVRYLRSLADTRSIIGELDDTSRVAVIGAGFIGLEVAASMRERDIDVVVIAPEEVPLVPIVGDTLGRLVADLHRDHGVELLLGRGVSEIRTDEVVLDDGSSEAADLVVVGIGVVPRTGLAEEAGLDVERGILVDAHLRTSDPHVWAAGDVASYPGPDGDRVRIEHWVLAQRHGQHVARSMLGNEEPFTDPPFFWSQHYETPINVVGHLGGWDEDVVVGAVDEREVTVGYRRAGTIRAVATIGRDRDNLRAEYALETGDQDSLEGLLED